MLQERTCSVRVGADNIGLCSCFPRLKVWLHNAHANLVLSCLQLLAGKSKCVGSTVLTTMTGEISTATIFGGNYSAGADCSWTINMPDNPYIRLSFTAFDSESLYDLVIVEVRLPHGGQIM